MNGGYRWQDSQTYKSPISRPEAEIIFERFLEDIGNPDLRAGSVVEHSDKFTADILNKEGAFVDRVQIDRKTGQVYDRFGSPPGFYPKAFEHQNGSDFNYCPYCGSPLNTEKPKPKKHSELGMPNQRFGEITPVNKDQAEKKIQDHLKSLKNPNLMIGKETETRSAFEFEIVTKKNKDLVDVLTIDKYSGYMRSVY